MNSPEIDCNCDEFKNGKCTECGQKCEHWEIQDGQCLVCGMLIEPPEKDFMSLAHDEMENGDV